MQRSDSSPKPSDIVSRDRLFGLYRLRRRLFIFRRRLLIFTTLFNYLFNSVFVCVIKHRCKRLRPGYGRHSSPSRWARPRRRVHSFHTFLLTKKVIRSRAHFRLTLERAELASLYTPNHGTNSFTDQGQFSFELAYLILLSGYELFTLLELLHLLVQLRFYLPLQLLSVN